MRGPGWRALRGRALGCALVLGMGAAPAPVFAQNSVELARARQVLEYYQACERTRRFAPCWDLLSSRVRAEWSRQGRGTVDEYAAARGAGERRFSDFRVLQIRRSPARVVFVVEATGGTERSPVWERVEYALVHEGGQWRIDGRRVGQSETVP
jgi:hypothetical protein